MAKETAQLLKAKSTAVLVLIQKAEGISRLGHTEILAEETAVLKTDMVKLLVAA